MEEQSLLLVGSTIRIPFEGSYVVEALLGTGGFGAVYRVRAQHAEQRVFALKEEINPDRHRRASFAFEADLLRRLHHSALPRVHRVFEDEQHQRVYMLMEYIAGQTLEVLRKHQPEGRFPLPTVLELMGPIVDALIYLHHQDPPIVHRDIKPSNIIVPPQSEKTVLVDFGIAKEYVENRTTNVIRHVTPGFAAPEQYGGGTTPLADLYSLGATFYTLLTGQIPPDALLRATKSSDPLQPACLIAPGIPEGVDEAIERAMAIDSDARFETVEQFWQEFRQHTSQPPEQLAQPGAPTSPPAPSERKQEAMPRAAALKAPRAPRSQRQRAMLLLALMLLVVVAGGTGLLLSALGNRGAPAASPHSGRSVPASATPALAAICSTLPTSIPTSGSPGYPTLSPCYAGEIGDLLAHEQTPMYLINVQQSQAEIRGTFQGLGLVGPFQGTVTPDEQLHFTLAAHGGEQTLDFQGMIKIGGDIEGSFRVYNQHGEFTGEYGPWNVGAYP